MLQDRASTAAALGILVLAAPASAAVIFQQDFNSKTLANVTGTTPHLFTSVTQGTGADPHAVTITNDAFYFKNAVDTTYPGATAYSSNFDGTLGASAFALSFVAAPITTVNAGNTAVSLFVNAGGRQLRLDLRVQGTTTAPRIEPRAEGGATLASSATPVNILIVGNPSPSDYTYTAPNGASRTLPTLKWDVWSGTSSSSLGVNMPTTTNSERLQLQLPGWSTANGTISIDDLRLETVPEPAALAIVLGASTLGLRRRRR